jgi:hypothetical protein
VLGVLRLMKLLADTRSWLRFITNRSDTFWGSLAHFSTEGAGLFCTLEAVLCAELRSVTCRTQPHAMPARQCLCCHHSSTHLFLMLVTCCAVCACRRHMQTTQAAATAEQ